ncbi:MAG: acyltransferase family protein [Candidatus Lokiarchaeota archaeon]|nr:acyltransferase family protein [Candidatus Lokiarchaeota archaeon]
MNDQNFQSIEQEETSALEGLEERTSFFQIDFLKAVMIFLVIFDHYVYWDIKRQIGAALWERISIPVFLVVLGLNMGLSFKRQGLTTLKQLYSWSYFKKKILRYVVPFLILYAASTFIGLFMYGFDFIAMYDTQYYPEHGIINLFTLIMPFWGPGNWFIPVLMGSILVVPLLYWGFTKKPVITLILTFVVEIVLHAIVFFVIGDITTLDESHILSVFMTSILFYLSAVGLGMWFSFGHKLTEKRNIFIWILFIISLVYLIAYQFFDFRFTLDGTPLLRGDYYFLVFPYSAFLVLLALRFLPNISKKKISKTISLIGKSTYHILLTQILGFGINTAFWGTHYGMFVPFDPYDLIDLALLSFVFVWLGIIWYKIDRQKDLARRILYYFNFFILFPCFLFFIFWMQTSWVPIPLIVIILYAIAAIILHFVIKKPINTRILAVWTGFLIISFISMILQVLVFLPSEFWILLIPMGAYLVFALYYTLSNKT